MVRVRRHSTTTRRCARNMIPHLSLRLLSVLLAGAVAEPTPGRVPKVYNALITSNQNLEPSKAYPVYQPVLHDAAFAFPFQPAVFYGGDFPISNGLLPPPALSLSPKSIAQPQSTDNPTEAKQPLPPSTESPPESPQPSSTPRAEGDGNPTAAPPLPPNTQSPIPLNEFGLPRQVLPLGRIDPAFEGFTQVAPFTYTYPGFRFYDPYDPFSFSPYTNLPSLYRPLPNLLGQPPMPVRDLPAPSATVTTEQTAAPTSAQSPPPEPGNLNELNYSSKDPAIPNVPPPPLPQGGLKSDTPE